MYSLFQEHEVVVGEHSTALVEASASGCKIGIYTKFEHPFSLRLVEIGVGQGFTDFGGLRELASNLDTSWAAREFFATPIMNIRERVEKLG